LVVLLGPCSMLYYVRSSASGSASPSSAASWSPLGFRSIIILNCKTKRWVVLVAVGLMGLAGGAAGLRGATASPTSNDVSLSSSPVKAAGKLIRHEVDGDAHVRDQGPEQQQHQDQYYHVANEKEKDKAEAVAPTATVVAGSSFAASSSNSNGNAAKAGAVLRVRQVEHEQELRRAGSARHAVEVLPVNKSARLIKTTTHSRADNTSDSFQFLNATVTAPRPRAEDGGGQSQRSSRGGMIAGGTSSGGGSSRSQSEYHREMELVEVELQAEGSTSSFHGHCARDERDTHIPKNKLCGYGSNIKCSPLHDNPGKGEHLNADGSGNGFSLLDFPQYTSGSCKYQGYFQYDGDRSTCRKACDRVLHCTHFAHKSTGMTGYDTSETCMLFNSCATHENAAYGTDGWPGYLSPLVYKCWSDCTSVTCSADAGRINALDKGETTCDNSCTTANCCTELPLCAANMCSGAGWKWSDSKSSDRCSDTSGASCEHECCQQLAPCSETPCHKVDGWKDVEAGKASLYCDPNDDASTCEQDCCEKMPDCSTDYGTDDATCNVAAPPEPQLWARKNNQTTAQAELYCTGNSCTREECCDGVCHSSLCGAEQVLNATAAQVRCEGVECTAEDCCVQQADPDGAVGAKAGANTTATTTNAPAVEGAASIELKLAIVAGGIAVLGLVFWFSDDASQPEDAATARFNY